MEVMQQPSLSETLAFIRQWLEYGDLKEACEKFQIDKSQGSKILRGKIKHPKVEFLAHLKKKAFENYQKLKV
jgi:predicted XRE-type DNA-binding protein